MTEHYLQQQIFTYHWNNYPSERGLLYMNYNTPPNAREGARLKGMGLIAGVSDLTYLCPSGAILFIEIKTETGVQSKAQKEWEQTVKENGYRYVIWRSLDDAEREFAREKIRRINNSK
jgi:hypothetical protein